MATDRLPSAPWDELEEEERGEVIEWLRARHDQLDKNKINKHHGWDFHAAVGALVDHLVKESE